MNFPQLPLPCHMQNDWQVAHNKRKRIRSPDDENKTNKITRSENYWLGNVINTHNRFETLNEGEGSEAAVTENHTHNITEPKPPPIFVAGVKRITPLIELLNEITPGKYTVKALHNDEVKIQPTTGKEYSTIIKALEEKQTEFHTYQPKQSKPFRVVLKNVHPSVNEEELKTSIQDLGHEVINIWNVKHRKTNVSLPMFFIDLKPKDNNKEIYNIKRLLNLVVRFEAPYTKHEIPQCMRCQKYGHTKNFCTRTPRCVKCAGAHLTKDCDRTTRDDNVKCANCTKNHPANYKGCEIYQQLHQKKLHLKYDRTSIRTAINNPQFVQTGISYAQKAQGTTTINNTIQTDTAAVPHTQLEYDMAELKNMMKDLITQMSTMLNLLTILVNKSSN